MSTVKEEVDRRMAREREQFLEYNASIARAMSCKTASQLVEFLQHDIGEHVYFMPAHVAALLDRYDELHRRLEAIEKLHHPHDCKADAEKCQMTSRVLGFPFCTTTGHCSGCDEKSPCSTVKAARGEL